MLASLCPRGLEYSSALVSVSPIARLFAVDAVAAAGVVVVVAVFIGSGNGDDEVLDEAVPIELPDLIDGSTLSCLTFRSV